MSQKWDARLIWVNHMDDIKIAFLKLIFIHYQKYDKMINPGVTSLWLPNKKYTYIVKLSKFSSAEVPFCIKLHQCGLTPKVWKQKV